MEGLYPPIDAAMPLCMGNDRLFIFPLCPEDKRDKIGETLSDFIFSHIFRLTGI